MILQQLPEVLDDQLGGSCLAVLLETLVDPDDVHQLMGEVVLAPLAGLQGDGGSHGHWRHRQHRQYHPLRPCRGRIHAHHRYVLIRDLLEAVPDIRSGELMALLDVGEGPLEFYLLLGSAAVGAGLVLAGLGKDLVHSVIGHLPQTLQLLDLLQVHLLLPVFKHKPGAIPAYCPQYLADQLGKAHVDHGGDEIDMSEVARALAGPATAGAATQAGIDDTEPGVHEAHLYGKTVVVVCISGDDLDHAHLPKLLRRDEAEADLADSLGNCHTFHLNRVFQDQPRGYT